MHADGKQKEGQTNCSLVFSKKYFLIPEEENFHFLPKENTQKYASKYCIELQQKEDCENMYSVR